jgi:hypothetical protein
MKRYWVNVVQKPVLPTFLPNFPGPDQPFFQTFTGSDQPTSVANLSSKLSGVRSTNSFVRWPKKNYLLLLEARLITVFGKFSAKNLSFLCENIMLYNIRPFSTLFFC